MRGHESIIAMRKAGKSPEWVFLNDWPCATDWAAHGDHATVSTHGDSVAHLDLRFLVGLQASISALTEDRAKDLFDAAKAAGARLVAACHVQAKKHAMDQAGWCEVWEKPAMIQEATHG